jgi:hypothetical protein
VGFVCIQAKRLTRALVPRKTTAVL